MQIYDFTLILKQPLQGTDEEADRLYESGCSDGSPAKINGVSYIAFDREADSLDEAIRTAIADVRSAGFDVTRVETDEFTTISQVNQELASA
jgi:hypothetical protein